MAPETGVALRVHGSHEHYGARRANGTWRRYSRLTAIALFERRADYVIAHEKPARYWIPRDVYVAPAVETLP